MGGGTETIRQAPSKGRRPTPTPGVWLPPRGGQPPPTGRAAPPPSAAGPSRGPSREVRNVERRSRSAGTAVRAQTGVRDPGLERFWGRARTAPGRAQEALGDGGIRPAKGAEEGREALGKGQVLATRSLPRGWGAPGAAAGPRPRTPLCPAEPSARAAAAAKFL